MHKLPYWFRSGMMRKLEYSFFNIYFFNWIIYSHAQLKLPEESRAIISSYEELLTKQLWSCLAEFDSEICQNKISWTGYFLSPLCYPIHLWVRIWFPPTHRRVKEGSYHQGRPSILVEGLKWGLSKVWGW